MGKHVNRKHHDTVGKPNAYEWFRYHTRLGTWFYDFDDADRYLIKVVAAIGTGSLLAIATVVTMFVIDMT